MGYPSWTTGHQESGLNPLLTTTASLAALALTSCYKQLALPPQQGRQWSPLFLLLTITAGWTLGGGGCATRSTQWALCAGPVAALCSMAVDGACANEARWGKRSESSEGAGGGAGPFGGCDALVSRAVLPL